MMELDMELEAEFDAQAFGSELRALKVRLDDSGSSFMLAATVPWTAEPARALERVKACSSSCTSPISRLHLPCISPTSPL